jgi:SHS2 domain-containing protein
MAGGQLERIEELPHTGDVGFRLVSDTPEGLFRLAAEGLRRAVGHQAAEAVLEKEEIRLQRPDSERLLVAWLRALLEGGERREAVPRTDALTLETGPGGSRTLAARVTWHPRAGAGPVREVKGVTYHGLRVARRDGGWEASLVLDV